MRSDQGLDDGGEVEELKIAGELLRLGPARLERGRLQPSRDHFAHRPGHAGKRNHQIVEDGLVDAEELGVFGAPDGGAPRRPGEQGEFAHDFTHAEESHGDRGGVVHRLGDHLEHARLDDVHPVAGLALLEHNGARAELFEGALREHGVENHGRLIGEQVALGQEINFGIRHDFGGGQYKPAPFCPLRLCVRAAAL